MISKTRNRKGQLGRIVSMTLIIVGAIVLYLFIAKVSQKATFDEAINACRLSVIAQSSTELAPTLSGLKSPFSINCEKRYVDIYNTRVELGLSPENMRPLAVTYGGKKTTQFKTLTESVVNQVIAEEMRICKYQFGDGKINIFRNNQEIVNGGVCFVCSEINFKSVNLKEVTSLLEYTQKTSYGEHTYYDYLTEKTISGDSMWIQPVFLLEVDKYKEEAQISESDLDEIITSYVNLNIDTNKKYVIFVKKDSLLWDNGISINILPHEELNNLCSLQAD
ncbi:MAG TPA: hypothetical protein VEC16_02740 [Alphaproteobacteria bacterium]|nr:hypothetical protein [Alphaproteobacteria bacterium]